MTQLPPDTVIEPRDVLAEALHDAGSDWDKVLAATEGHNIANITTTLFEVESWTYIRCSCGEPGEPFTEPWEFTDHIRRLVFEALAADRLGEAFGPATEEEGT